MMVLMMQVNRIMITTPLSMLSSTSCTPGDTSVFMPTITMAMAPAAWADVRPHIMCPHFIGILKWKLAM